MSFVTPVLTRSQNDRLEDVLRRFEALALKEETTSLRLHTIIDARETVVGAREAAVGERETIVEERLAVIAKTKLVQLYEDQAKAMGHKILTGPKGGKFYMKGENKHYISRMPKLTTIAREGA